MTGSAPWKQSARVIAGNRAARPVTGCYLPVMQSTSMASRQNATPPAWLGRGRWSLLRDALGSLHQNLDKVRQLAALLVAFVRPSVVRRRLERLIELGHADARPTWSQLLLAARDQMILSATAETKIFYANQGIPWTFHNVRRFLSGPATMLDPMGLFSSRETIVHHVLQTFHRHPVYDLVLLRAHEGGVEALRTAAAEILAGTHPHQRALSSLIEDGAYHQRLPAEIAAFEADPHVPARPIPAGLVADPGLMLGMDQFKDVRGFVRYASRLRPAGVVRAVIAWLAAGFDETFGSLLRMRLGTKHINTACCDPELVARHMPSLPSPRMPQGRVPQGVLEPRGSTDARVDPA